MTSLHLSTVGMSVRNTLVMLGGRRTAEEIFAALRHAWPVELLDVEEITLALGALRIRGLVTIEGDGYQATDKRFFRRRTREQEGMTDGDHWEGWTE